MTKRPTAPPISSKPSRWIRFYLAIGTMEALLVVFWFLGVVWVGQLSETTAVGGGLVLGLLLPTLLLVAAPLAFLVLIGLPIRMFKEKPQGKWFLFCAFALLSSLMPAYAGASLGYSHFIQLPADERVFDQKWEEEKRQEAEILKRTSREVTKEEALDLLNHCQITHVYYGNQSDRSGFNWGELSTTGVVVADIEETTPYSSPLKKMSLSDKLADELLAIADAVGKDCGRPGIHKSGEP